jgi:hypothetical protein
MDVKNSNPQFVDVGGILMEEARLASPRIALSEAPPESLLSNFALRYEATLQVAVPVTSEYVFQTKEGYEVLCRGVLLPLSEAGEMIDYIYGVVGWTSRKLPAGDERLSRASQ